MFFVSSPFHLVGESEDTINKDLISDQNVSPDDACSKVLQWTNEVVELCLSKEEDGEQKESILAASLFLLHAAKGNRRQLEINSCRSVHPSCKQFLSELEKKPLPGITGISAELCDRLVPRIAFAWIMKLRPDSRLSQLSKC